jgi:hypothetical protein
MIWLLLVFAFVACVSCYHNGKHSERRAVVAYLRSSSSFEYGVLANCIERGEHIPEPDLGHDENNPYL